MVLNKNKECVWGGVCAFTWGGGRERENPILSPWTVWIMS